MGRPDIPEKCFIGESIYKYLAHFIAISTVMRSLLHRVVYESTTLMGRVVYYNESESHAVFYLWNKVGDLVWLDLLALRNDCRSI